MTGSPIRLFVSSVLLWAGIAGSLGAFPLNAVAASQALQPPHQNIPPQAGPNRPEDVPSGYVITPFGYFAPSCVQSLAQGDRLLKDGRIEHANGTEEGYVATCTSPHFTANGTMVKANPTGTGSPGNNSPLVASLPTINGWVESANVLSNSTTTSFGGILATWTVPPSPSTNDGQVLFFFPGFEDIANTQSILQPVLQWNQGQWSIASWNCCLSGIVTSSPAVNVSSGDQIYGSITNQCAPGTPSCSTWNVLTLDLATGQSTTLNSTPSAGQYFNWAFGAVMEVYSITRCEDYPSDRKTKFGGIVLFDNNLQPITSPPWAGSINSTSTPQCRYRLQTQSQQISLDY